jgi:hypothetical protein
MDGGVMFVARVPCFSTNGALLIPYVQAPKVPLVVG